MTEKAEELLTLREAAKRMGFTEAYVRMLIRRGKLKTKKVPLGPESIVWKHMIIADDVAKLAKKPRGLREDGRRKYIVYATEDELMVAKQVLTDAGLKDFAAAFKSTKQQGVYQIRKAKMINKQLSHDN